MKNIAAILLLSIYLLSSTSLREVVKLPLLISHFIDHKAQVEGLTLWQFFQMHYAGENIKTAHDTEDAQLPFKTHNLQTGILVLNIPPPCFSLTNKYSLKDIKKVNFLFRNESLSSSYLSSIWQPPRIS